MTLADPLVAFVAILAFAAAVRACGLVGAASGGLELARGALAALHDPALDDEAKEQALQRASLGLFAVVGSIALRSLAALFAAFAPVWLADTAGFAAADSVMALLLRWDVIVLASLAALLGWWLAARPWAHR